LTNLFHEAARLTAEGMQVEFCSILEFISDENQFLVRAGWGWDHGVVGSAVTSSDGNSPAGVALQTGKPVISNSVQNEHRFKTPDLLISHGIRRVMCVVLPGNGTFCGVLEIGSRSDEYFVAQDIAFLQSVANLLAMAAERERNESILRATLARNQALFKEMITM
jgi:GAF domain-containing protein